MKWKTIKHYRNISLAEAWQVFIVFLRLGLFSFGGPIAHLGYFHREFVEKRKWLEDQRFADLLALCQFLPGPASSQLGYSIGLYRAGLAGGLAAWLGFTLPSAIIMLLCAAGLNYMHGELAQKLLHGLLILAAAVVAHAVHGMARRLTPDFPRAFIALATASCMYFFASSWLQVGLIAAGALLGICFLKSPDSKDALTYPGRNPGKLQYDPRIPLAIFALLLIGLPLLLLLTDNPVLVIFEAFYRSGALVFGGGHVVLPLLQEAMVSPGWIDDGSFLAGYGAAQALPGPLFSFAAFLGASQNLLPGIVWPGLLALIAIFLPGNLLVTGLIPYWDRLRAKKVVRRAILGSNATVVGLLLAALMDPVIPKAILSLWDAALAMLILALLLYGRPLWLAISVCLLCSIPLPN